MRETLPRMGEEMKGGNSDRSSMTHSHTLKRSRLPMNAVYILSSFGSVLKRIWVYVVYGNRVSFMQMSED